MTSIVCYCIPSTQDITITIISVTFAPLYHISLKASCPGVSINVMSFPFQVLNEKAAIDYVISPNSPATLLEFLNLSSKVVFPWSTCPIIVTIGGHYLNFELS